MDLKQQYDGLIFDCDGTLTDSMPLHYIAWHETMARYGIEFTEERFYAMGGMRTEKIVEILANDHNKTLNAKQAAIEKEEAFMARISDLKPRADICEIAKSHLGVIPMAVASGSEKVVVHAQLEIIGLTHAFPVVVAAEDTHRHKPEPDVFLKAAELLGVNPTRCLVYEDSPMGFQAAKAAGMDYVDVR